jgi:hypothetical protein
MQHLDEFVMPDLEKLGILANFKWICRNYDTIKKEFGRRYVAVHDRQIVGSDTNLERLVERLNIQNYDKTIAIEYIHN